MRREKFLLPGAWGDRNTDNAENNQATELGSTLYVMKEFHKVGKYKVVMGFHLSITCPQRSLMEHLAHHKWGNIGGVFGEGRVVPLSEQSPVPRWSHVHSHNLWDSCGEIQTHDPKRIRRGKHNQDTTYVYLLCHDPRDTQSRRRERSWRRKWTSFLSIPFSQVSN